MKFGKQLERHKVPGWDAFYIDYNGLKRSLQASYSHLATEKAVNGGDQGSSSDNANSLEDKHTPRTSCQPSDIWLAELEASIDKVNEFFISVADEVEGRLVAGSEELSKSQGSGVELQLKQHLQSMVQKLHATLLDLSNFAAANYMAVYKILKKHDKHTGLCLLPPILRQVAKEPFHDPGKARLESLQSYLRDFAQMLGVDNELQLAALPDKSAFENSWPLIRLSFSLGVIAMALAVLAVLSGMEPQRDQFSVEALAATIPIFRLSFMMNLSVWLAGCCAFMFERYKINYLFLLDISPELDVTAISLLNFASVQTGIWIVFCFALLADVKFGAVLLMSHPEIMELGWSLAHVYSVALLLLQSCMLLSWVSSTHRHFFSALMARVASFALLGEVTFAENILADFLTSLGRPLKDLAYTACYLSHWRTLDIMEVRSTCKPDSGLAWAGLQFVVVLPLLIRISQCLRRIRDTGHRYLHLLNCGKYTVATLVSLLAALPESSLGLSHRQVHALRIFGYITATFYAASWDLVVDFGLLSVDRRCFFPWRFYVVLAGSNVMLRSTWLLTYQPDLKQFVHSSTFNSECFAFMIAGMELIRRAIWATVRLEHEHLSNASRFRSVCWVPPLEHRRPAERHLSTKDETPLSPQRPVLGIASSQVFAGGALLKRSKRARLVALASDANQLLPPAPPLLPTPSLPAPSKFKGSPGPAVAKSDSEEVEAQLEEGGVLRSMSLRQMMGVGRQLSKEARRDPEHDKLAVHALRSELQSYRGPLSEESTVIRDANSQHSQSLPLRRLSWKL